jgi:actin-related protein 6
MAPKRGARDGARAPSTAADRPAASSPRGDVTVVVDLGGSSLKLCVAEDGATATRSAPNASARVKASDGAGFVTLRGEEIDGVVDVNGLALRRPCDRGYVVHWEQQREILDDALRRTLGVDPTRCDLIITEPPFALPRTREALDEMVFEYFGFRRALVTTPAKLTKRFADFVDAKKRDAKDLCVVARSGVVLDCGFSFAHATAFVDGTEVPRGIKRLNLGGKALTNYLKELVSFRQWNMMDESAVIEDVKEKMCYVADDALAELEKCKAKRGGTVKREYVLPDGIHVLRGFVREDSANVDKKDGSDDDEELSESDEDDDDFGASGRTKKRPKKKVPKEKKVKIPKKDEPEHQFLTLVNERFMVPEVLFHPSDIGGRQCGVAELVTQAVENEDLSNEAMRALAYLDVIVTGGCSKFPNFMERFERELRPLVSESYMLRIRQMDDPIQAACLGGVDIAKDREFFEKHALTKEEYLANKTSIRAAHESLEFEPNVRTGRLREYAATPNLKKLDKKRIIEDCEKLTPSFERDIIHASA